jgi:hypothetical protein
MLGPWVVLTGASMAVGGLLKGLEWTRSVLDGAVEIKHRSETGEARRQIVRLDLFITPEGLEDLNKNPVLDRAFKAFQRLEALGHIKKCPTCKHPVTR